VLLLRLSWQSRLVVLIGLIVVCLSLRPYTCVVLLLDHQLRRRLHEDLDWLWLMWRWLVLHRVLNIKRTSASFTLFKGIKLRVLVTRFRKSIHFLFRLYSGLASQVSTYTAGNSVSRMMSIIDVICGSVDYVLRCWWYFTAVDNLPLDWLPITL